MNSGPVAWVPGRVTFWILIAAPGPRHLPISSSDLTQKPDIHILEPLESGRPTQLSCSLPGSCKAGSPLIFSWVGDALDSQNPKILRSSMLIFTPKPRDHGTTVTCLVTLAGPGVTTQETIRLNVSCECWRDGWCWRETGTLEPLWMYVCECVCMCVEEAELT